MNAQQCSYCNSNKGVIWVHGHGQCAHCKTNIDECCRGEKELNNSRQPTNSPQEN